MSASNRWRTRWCAFVLISVSEVLGSLLGVQVPPSRGESFLNVPFVMKTSLLDPMKTSFGEMQ